MALIKCRECKGQVSSTAQTCPHCGVKVKKPTSVLGSIVFGLLIIVGGAAMIGGKSDPKAAAPPLTPEQLASEQKAKTESAEDLARVCVLRQALKNPDSFKLVSAIRTAAGELCVTYRGTNSFNAVITDTVKFPTFDSKKPPHTGGSCTGKDVTSSVSWNLGMC
jgi:hypothetical protein